MKPFIKFCTPFYREWDIDLNKNPIRNNPPLPIETSFDKLVNEIGIDQCNGMTVYELPEFKFIWQRCQGTYIAESRNSLINERKSDEVFQKLYVPYTHFFMLDSDISFLKKHILNLLSYNKNIISGCYIERTHPGFYTAGYWESQRIGVIDTFVNIKNIAKVDTLLPVDWTGAGFLLVKKEVFEKIPYEWFETQKQYYTNKNGKQCVYYPQEDIGFCMLAKKYGYSVFLDTKTIVKHHLINKSSSECNYCDIYKLKSQGYDLYIKNNNIISNLQQIKDLIAQKGESNGKNS